MSDTPKRENASGPKPAEPPFATGHADEVSTVQTNGIQTDATDGFGNAQWDDASQPEGGAVIGKKKFPPAF